MAMSGRDFVVELVGGRELPLAPIADVHVSILLETISSVWAELVSEESSILATGDEKGINTLLSVRLNHYRETSLMWRQMVNSVGRGVETMNYNGDKLEKRPDLSIHLTDRNANFPVTVECKIIDHANSKGVDLYCSNGIARFVGGDYAWMNGEAVMLAYVRDGSTTASKLTPKLAKSAKATPDPYLTSSHPALCPEIHPTVHVSKHGRDFSYLPECNGTVPGDIALAHLWLTI